MGLQARALPEQHELNETNPVDLGRQLPSRLLQRSGHTANERVRPVDIAGTVVSRFQRSEQGVVVQPVRLRVDEVLEVAAQIRARAGTEALPCALEQDVLETRDGVVID